MTEDMQNTDASEVEQSATDDQAAPESVEPESTEAESSESDVDYWKRRARENEERSKANHRELEKLRKESMSDQERAMTEARESGYADAVRAMSSRVVDAEVRSAANGRPVNVDVLLESIDRSKFLDEDGNVDREAITGWLDQLAPVQQQEHSGPDLGQGTRGVNRSDPADVFGQLITGSLK